MPNFEQITILGHAGRTPELRRTQDGTAVTNFSVAVKNYKGNTQWYDVSAFGNTAEKYVCPYLKKGQVVMVTGTPVLETFQKKDGTMASKFAIKASSVQICSKAEEAEAPPVEPQGAQIIEDEIPF